MPINPPKEETKADQAKVAAQTARRTAATHAVLLAFLIGEIVGFAFAVLRVA